MVKCRFCWEGNANTSVILTHLFCNETKLSHDHAVILYNTGVVKSQQPHVNKSYFNTAIGDQMYRLIELKPLQDAAPMENN